MITRKIRLMVMYGLITISLITYSIGKTIQYNLEMTQQELNSDINEKQEIYQDNMVEIDTLNSKEQASENNPDLAVNDNIYYLEKNEQ